MKRPLVILGAMSHDLTTPAVTDEVQRLPNLLLLPF